MGGIVVGGLHAHFKLAVKQLLAQRQGQARLGQDALKQGLHGRIQFFGWHHAVDQALNACFFGAHEFARGQHFKGFFAGEVARQGHAGGGAKQAQVDAADGKACAVCRHRQVALGHQLASTP